MILRPAKRGSTSHGGQRFLLRCSPSDYRTSSTSTIPILRYLSAFAVIDARSLVSLCRGRPQQPTASTRGYRLALRHRLRRPKLPARRLDTRRLPSRRRRRHQLQPLRQPKYAASARALWQCGHGLLRSAVRLARFEHAPASTLRRRHPAPEPGSGLWSKPSPQRHRDERPCLRCPGS